MFSLGQIITMDKLFLWAKFVWPKNIEKVRLKEDFGREKRRCINLAFLSS